MGQNKEFIVYYKTFKKGLKVQVSAKNRAEAIKIVKDSIKIIKVDQVFNPEIPFDKILKDTSFISMFISGWAGIFRRIKKLFVK